MRRSDKEQIIGYLLILPAFLLVLIFLVYPFLNSFYMSFHKWPVFGDAKFVGLKNYIKVWKDDQFWNSLYFTFLYTITVTPMLFAFAIPTALLCNIKAKGSTLFRSVYFFPVVLSFAVSAYVWIWLYNESNGVFMYGLRYFGIISEDYNIWLERNSSLLAVNIQITWKFFGISMIILLAGLQSISDDYYEASKLMGASRMQTIWNVTLPLIKTSIVLSLILSIAGSMQVYEPFLIMTQGSPANSTKTLVMHIVDVGLDYYKLGPAAAMGTIFMIILLIITSLQLLFLRKDNK